MNSGKGTPGFVNTYRIRRAFEMERMGSCCSVVAFVLVNLVMCHTGAFSCATDANTRQCKVTGGDIGTALKLVRS